MRLFAGIWTQGVSARLALLRPLGWLGACLLAGLTDWALPCAQAHEHPPVALRVDACVPVHVQQVRQLLALELQSELVDEPSGPEVARAFVSCPASVLGGDGLTGKEAGSDELAGQQTDLRVDDPVTGRSLVRSIDLQHADPEVRARLLSLALSELLFACWAEQSVAGSAMPAPTVAPASPGGASEPLPLSTTDAVVLRPASVKSLGGVVPVPKLGLTLAAMGSLLMIPGEPRLLWLGGAGVRLQGDLARHLGFSTDFSYHHGSAETTLGSVTSDLLSLQAAAHLHHQLPALTLRSGLGARLGAARLAGQPTDALMVRSDALWGVWGGPQVFLGLTTLLGRARLEVQAETGYIVAPVAAKVAGVRAVGLNGPWLGISLGLGFLVR